MNPTNDAQVLVVGAGPVGLAMAAELARLEVPVRIVEKTSAPSDKSKALVIWTRTLELMQIMGCADAFLKNGLHGNRATLRASERVLAQIEFGKLDTPYPFALFLPQSETERLLTAHLEALGVRVERETELVAFTDGPQGVAATLRHGDGREEAFRTGWLVGCDGAHSTVRHRLGLEFEGEAEPNDWLLADVHLDGPARTDEAAIFLDRSGVLALFPVDGRRYRVIADLGRRRTAPEPPEPPTLAAVQEIIDRRGPRGLTARDPGWLTRFAINERKVGEYRAGHVFLAGDAAHIHSPAGGQGMNTGIQDAVNLAWKLALVHRGVATAASPLLASYSPERSAVAAHVLRGAATLTRMGTLRNPLVQTLRNLALRLITRVPAIRTALATMLGELDIGYRRSLLSRRAASARGKGTEPGERVPASTIRKPDGGGVPLYEALRDGRFIVLTACGDLESEQAVELLHRFGDVCRLGGTNADGADIEVIRPDGYLGLRAGPHDWKAVAGYFEDLLVAAE